MPRGARLTRHAAVGESGPPARTSAAVRSRQQSERRRCVSSSVPRKTEVDQRRLFRAARAATRQLTDGPLREREGGRGRERERSWRRRSNRRRTEAVSGAVFDGSSSGEPRSLAPGLRLPACLPSAAQAPWLRWRCDAMLPPCGAGGSLHRSAGWM